MADGVDGLIEKVKQLTERQLVRVQRIVDSILNDSTYTADPESDIASAEFCLEFGDALRQHHSLSGEAFTKDKFEWAMVAILNDLGRKATKSTNGNPGNDITVDGVPWSLKTQADRNIRSTHIHISKYKELGKGDWADPAGYVALREGMFEHMKAYERIFTLRRISPGLNGSAIVYELVEIPKALLLEAAGQKIEIQYDSRQTPKPAYCKVYDSQTGRKKFELYFDGGSERKLQVKALDKSYCTVHATWTFKAPQ